MANDWTIRKEGEGLERRYYFNDGKRDRATMRKFRFGSVNHWRVTRLHQRLDGSLLEGGSDLFKSFAAAKAFVTENPNVWGI